VAQDDKENYLQYCIANRFFIIVVCHNTFPCTNYEKYSKIFFRICMQIPKKIFEYNPKVHMCFNSSVCHPPCTKNIHMMRMKRKNSYKIFAFTMQNLVQQQRLPSPLHKKYSHDANIF